MSKYKYISDHRPVQSKANNRPPVSKLKPEKTEKIAQKTLKASKNSKQFRDKGRLLLIVLKNIAELVIGLANR